ncbi:MAG: hypothetical protein RL459_2044 [Pseudomonadota bacterium]
MILVAGSANLDFVVRAPHIPAPGETVLGSELRTFPGGKGANQAIACARAGGASTTMLLSLGNDDYAKPIEASLVGAGVQLHVIRDDLHATGTAFICVSDDGENAITVASGANLALRPEHLPPLQGFSHLLLQLETPLASVLAYAQAARAQGVSVVLNAAPAQDLSADLLGLIDILIVNEGELAALAGASGTIAQQIESLPVPGVVVTLGHQGCCACLDGQWYFEPAHAITPVDTTAAGDTFCGALVAAMAQARQVKASTQPAVPIAMALKRASAAAAIACTRPGAQNSIPTRADVDALLALAPPPTAAAINELRRLITTDKGDMTPASPCNP